MRYVLGVGFTALLIVGAGACGDDGSSGDDGGGGGIDAGGDGDGCRPVSCGATTCGRIDNGCGGTIECGGCRAPETCGGGGVPNACGCTPSVTCASAGAECGSVDDGCGTELPCTDTCVAPETCGGGPATDDVNECGCTPAMTCASLGLACGSFTDDCGTDVTCPDTCVDPETCGGGGTDNECGCTPTVTCAGVDCGTITDDCDNEVTCPDTCVLPETCGGAGVTNECGARTLRAGDACDPAMDLCGPGLACCTRCCREGATPRCAATDALGRCPLPDLTVDVGVLMSSVSIETRSFSSGDCGIVEGCVDAAGSRRLLRFGTQTPNTGTADLDFGPPGGNPLFVFSPCHGHYHFSEYADYRLLRADGTVVDEGHKQAFCLIDLVRLPGTTTSPRYNCSNQGIQMGWADIYSSSLDCQWIDITGVAAGMYTLEVHINPERIIPELDYTNNVARVPVTVP